MNKVVLIGRLTSDPHVYYGKDENVIAKYSLAVDRISEGTDFIGCVCFGKCGEFADKWLKKGMKIAIEGRLQSGSYEKDGTMIYTTDVVVSSHEFCEKKKEEVEEKKGYRRR